MKNLYLILAVLTLLSCSSERKAQYHHQKAVKHGLKVIQDSDTIRITTLDSFPVIKNDTIVWEKFYTTKDTVIKFNNIYVPKTRFQTRIEYKERVKTIKIQGQTNWKTAKATQVVKYRINWWIVLISFILGILVRFLVQKGIIDRIVLAYKSL
jgi:5-formaminoimidazole-4-carboxamide-1-beta-D-ribofuranosyl 5'-monophosphate synthetase